MAERRRFWRNLSPHKARGASHRAVAGRVAASGVAPLLPGDWRLIANTAALGKLIVVWQLTRINIGTPG